MLPISNRGGLPETITNGIILRNLSVKSLFNAIEKLIKNSKQLKILQKQSIKNFYLTDDYISNKIDNYRDEIYSKFRLSFSISNKIEKN